LLNRNNQILKVSLAVQRQN